MSVASYIDKRPERSHSRLKGSDRSSTPKGLPSETPNGTLGISADCKQSPAASRLTNRFPAAKRMRLSSMD